jgi:hypothetical protein
MATKITDDMLAQFAVIGTYDEIVPKMIARSAGVIDRVTFQLPVRNADDEAMLKELIGKLKAA